MKKLSILLLMALCLACAKKKADPQPANPSISTGFYPGSTTETCVETNANTIDAKGLTISQDSIGYLFYFMATQDAIGNTGYCKHRVTISGNTITMVPHVIDTTATSCTMSLQWGHGTINNNGSITMEWQYYNNCAYHFHWSGTFKK